jgi:very-short-patch-repair endonuclease
MKRLAIAHDYAKARKLRQQLSLPEALLWRELRGKPLGMKFRKQHPVGPFVIDFYCAQAKTGFEIDGIAHDMGDRPQADARRDAFIAAQGITIERIAAREVLADPARVADMLVRACLAKVK